MFNFSTEILERTAVFSLCGDLKSIADINRFREDVFYCARSDEEDETVLINFIFDLSEVSSLSREACSMLYHLNAALLNQRYGNIIFLNARLECRENLEQMHIQPQKATGMYTFCEGHVFEVLQKLEGFHIARQEYSNGVVVLSPKGQLIGVKSQRVLELLVNRDLKDSRGVIIDCHEVTVVDTEGIGQIARLEAITRDQHVRFVLCSVQDTLMRVITQAHLERYFTIFASRQEAVSELQQIGFDEIDFSKR